VVLQIGPVVVGTALRDSLPFVSFGSFVNQLEFAQVSRSLNDKAVGTIRSGFPFDSATGKTVRFAGAGVQVSAGQPLQVTPVSLELAGDAS
jgi:predicted lipoprotein